MNLTNIQEANDLALIRHYHDISINSHFLLVREEHGYSIKIGYVNPVTCEFLQEDETERTEFKDALECFLYQIVRYEQDLYEGKAVDSKIITEDPLRSILMDTL